MIASLIKVFALGTVALVPLFLSALAERALAEEVQKEQPIWTLQNKACNVMASADCKFDTAPHNEFNIQSGTMLVRTLNKPVVVHTPRSIMNVMRDSLILIQVDREYEDAFAVLGQTGVEIDGKHADLMRGDESVVCGHEPYPGRRIYMPNMQIARRHMRLVGELPDWMALSMGEYCIAQLLKDDDLIKKLAASEEPGDKKLIKRVSNIKLGKDRTPYVRLVRSRQ